MPEKNRLEGKSFEEVLQYQAKRCGLLVQKNHLSAKYIAGGKVKIEKSNLDFMLANQQGRVAFVDAKSFEGSSFNFSMISENQLKRAALYNEYSIPSGFVVFFRTDQVVCFFSGKYIQMIGARNSINVTQGTYLGKLWNFDLGLVFTTKFTNELFPTGAVKG